LRGSGTAASTRISDATCRGSDPDSPPPIRSRNWPRTGVIGKDAVAGMNDLDVIWLA
jgi:hypothetical protein